MQSAKLNRLTLVVAILLLVSAASTSLVRLDLKLSRVDQNTRQGLSQPRVPPPEESAVETMKMKLTVPQTSIEAQAAKKSAVQRGYFVDDFIQYFIKGDYKETFHPNLRRDYWIRVFTMRSIQKQFLSKVGDDSDLSKRQIINFGCGLDTAAFNLIKDKSKYADFSYYEFDLSEIAEKKARAIKRTPAIQKLISTGGPQAGSSALINSASYKLASCNLSDLDSLDSQLKDLKVDFRKPTLILTEFVLPYIESDALRALLSYLAKQFQNIAMLDHSIININDEDGKFIIEAFQERNVSLRCLDFFNTPQSVADFYQQIGFSIDIRLVEEIYHKCIDQEERKRVESIDKFEDAEAIMKHYIFSLAKKCVARDSDVVPSAECRILDRLSLAQLRG